MSTPLSTYSGPTEVGVVYLYIRTENGTYSEKIIIKMAEGPMREPLFEFGCHLDDTNVYVKVRGDVYFYQHGITEGEKITNLVQYKV